MMAKDGMANREQSASQPDQLIPADYLVWKPVKRGRPELFALSSNV
ncbi:MAG: hypothetical protein AB7D36_06235 [Oscillospiraceae bacterium]